MKKKLILALLVAFLVMGFTTGYTASKRFKDVNTNDWHYEYIMKATEMGIIDGFKDNTFRPNEPLTRAQLAKILVKYDEQIDKQISETTEDEQQIINAVASVIPSTVKIDSIAGVGSGFFVKSNYILTNEHVVRGNSTVSVTTSTGEILTGTVEEADQMKDIALIYVDKQFKHLNFETDISVGQTALAIGNPLRIDDTVTRGIVSKTNISNGRSSNMFQMDTPVNKGSSGGAVINSKGQVIGMTTAKLMDAEGIAFAISAISLKEFVDEHTRQ